MILILKLLVISDTHHTIENAVNLIKKHNPDYVLHLGDMCADCAELQRIFPNKIILSVMGNNDFPQRYPDIPYERTFSLGGKKFFMCHGHKYNVKFGLERLYFKSGEIDADIVLFGHTHGKYLEKDNGRIFMNPGSVRSYGIIEIENGKTSARLENYEQQQ